MAYMSQERKAMLAPRIKEILKKYRVKGSLSVNNHSTLCLKVKEGDLDFIGNFNEARKTRDASDRVNPAKEYLSVNPYWYKDHFTDEVLEFLAELFPAMNEGNHDNSDIQSDYFDVGWYVDVEVGAWNKPYICTIP